MQSRSIPSRLEEHASYQAADLECDVVMKGGVTSGIVYPRAICRLAQRFKLRSVGGTSAGAIAAACAAAAELGRGTEGAGFARLADLPRRLGTEVNGQPYLTDLFQPTPSTRVLMSLYGALSTPGSLRRKVTHAGLALLLDARRPVTLGGLLVGLGLALAIGSRLAGWERVAVLPLPILGAIAGATLDTAHALFRRVPRQMFGICSGRTMPGARRAALTDWLDAELRACAGLAPEAAPLTFADLRGANVDLQVITTCLTHGRPYALPGLRRTLYFDPTEFRALFPESVVAHLETVGRAIVARDRARAERAIEHRGMHPRLPLPRGDALPVIVAVRMSLAFPVLLSAVPLWDYDWGGDGTATSANRRAHGAWCAWARDHREAFDRYVDHPDEQAPPGAPFPLDPDRIWFSDGGISSNFPIHLFDTPLPFRPTVAIDLRYRPAGSPDLDNEARVQLAQSNADRIDEDWTRISPEPGRPNRLIPFLARILGSMQNWNDTTLTKVPGYRDRVATVHLSSNEGGLNLEMDAALIESLAGFGERAGIKLRERFEDAEPSDSQLDWTNHRWTRLRTTLAVFEDWLHALHEALEAEIEPSFDALIERRSSDPPASYRLEANQRALFTSTLDQLRALRAALDAAGEKNLGHRAPRPVPTLRIVPRLNTTGDESSSVDDGCASGVCDITMRSATPPSGRPTT